MNKLLLGDSLDVLKEIESESVDLLCTDPPYGYSFMGKSWDKTLPDIGIFKECLRVLKPGSFAFVMSAPRSDVCARMMLMLEDAGFEIGFTPIYWTYASGFPKAMNIGKMVDKRLGHTRERIAGAGAGTPGNTFPLANEAISPEAISPEAISLDGSYGGFQPKPAVEVIIVAMKPLSEKTFVDQALKNQKGITWLDDCRVPTGETTARPPSVSEWSGPYKGGHEQNGGHVAGRFPANLLVENSVLDTITCTCATPEGDIQIVPQDLSADADGTEATTPHAGQHPKNESAKSPKRSKESESPQSIAPHSPLHASLFTTNEDESHTEAPTATEHTDDGCEPSESETETSAFNAEQPKTSTSTTSSRTHASQNSSTKSATGASCALHATGKLPPTASSQQYSRFFDLDAWAKTLPFLIVPKAAKSEKNAGLGVPKEKNPRPIGEAFGNGSAITGHTDTKGNFHPTVKPFKLMSYLITLGSRPGDVVLDPFLGSGTTALAAKQLGRKYIGIEREKEYMDIAQARLDSVQDSLI